MVGWILKSGEAVPESTGWAGTEREFQTACRQWIAGKPWNAASGTWHSPCHTLRVKSGTSRRRPITFLPGAWRIDHGFRRLRGFPESRSGSSVISVVKFRPILRTLLSKRNIGLDARRFSGTIPLPQNPGRAVCRRRTREGEKDGWQSGRLRTPGKRVYRKVTGVRIPPHPLSVFRGGVPENVPFLWAQD